MIWFRRRHPVIRSNQKPSDTGFPAVSVHTNRPWDSMINQDTKGLAICYAGKTNQREDLVYVAFNVYWEGQTFELRSFRKCMNGDALQILHWTD